MALLIALGVAFLWTYALLLGTFFATALAVERLNRARPDRIQPGAEPPPTLVRRDRRQSVRSLATIALMLAVGQTLYREFGIGWSADRMSVVGIAASFLGSMLLFDTWFYWTHRLVHWPPLFRRVHRWHHMVRTPVVWSNNSDTWLDNLFLQSYWLVAHLLLPIGPWALLAHKLYDQVSGVIGHCGVERGGGLCRPGSPLISVTHHDQHHRFFSCNYATHFTLWDRLMGTLHPTHDAELGANLARARESTTV